MPTFRAISRTVNLESPAMVNDCVYLNGKVYVLHLYMYICTLLCRYLITLYRYELFIVVSHVDHKIKDNKQQPSYILII
jgi:hypothetical protein